MFSVKNLSAGYNKPVVSGITFGIAAGEFCALLGLNGSGKTTLLKTICGLLPVKDGRCFINGCDCTKFNEYKRAKYISYIPQRHSKLQGVTVMDAVLMGLNSKLGPLEFPTRTDKEYAVDILVKMGLEHSINNDFSKLSEGQKQLIILARTLVQNTPVMMMDEPDSALDFLNRGKILARIKQLVHNEKKACLITLHDPNLALEYCDRLILLANGGISADITLVGSSEIELQAALSTVYGNIKLLKHGGKYIAAAP